MTYVVLLKSVATYQLFWPPADRCRVFSIGCIVNGLYYIVVSNPHKYSPKPAHIYACMTTILMTLLNILHVFTLHVLYQIVVFVV